MPLGTNEACGCGTGGEPGGEDMNDWLHLLLRFEERQRATIRADSAAELTFSITISGFTAGRRNRPEAVAVARQRHVSTGAAIGRPERVLAVKAPCVLDS